jgi:thiamine-monophosphate kinase
MVTTDALVEDVHFRRAWLTPRRIGRKAYLVNASDIAAMGGAPRYCVVSVAAPARIAAADLLAVHAGIAAAARETGARVAGGNLSEARRLFISVTLIGAAGRRFVRRSGARPGDAVYVTGTLGEAALGLRLLRRNRAARGPAVRRYGEPIPRLQAGAALAASGCASAMIDVSDGLLQDLGHIAAASGVGAQIEIGRIPCSNAVRRAGIDLALHGGEDYELLFTVPPRAQAKLARIEETLGCRVTRIGVVTPPHSGIRLVDRSGHSHPATASGYDHFR